MVPVDSEQCLGRADFDTGWSASAGMAQIAFMRFGLVRGGGHGCAVLAENRFGDHFHRAVRAGHDAGFATYAAFLHHLNAVADPADGTVWTDIGAGCVFALTAHHGSAEIDAFDHMQTRRESRSGKQRDILRVTLCHDAGDFTGTAADTLFRVGDDEPVHFSLQIPVVPDAAAYAPAMPMPSGISVCF